MRILLSGANGFIGSSLANLLVKEDPNIEIYCLCREGNRKNLDVTKNLHVIEHDLLEDNEPKGLPKKIDIVFHLAGISKTFLKPREARNQFIQNITLTSNVIEIANKLGANKIIFASSVYVYSGTPNLPFKETSELSPTEALGGSKLASELLLKSHSIASETDIYALRLFTVYGPKSSETQFFPEAIKKIQNENEVAKFGSPDITRDFIYISDVLEAFKKAMVLNKRGFLAINIASGAAHTVLQAVSLIQELINPNKVINFEGINKNKKSVDSNHSADISVANEILGWNPQVELKKGIELTLEAQKEK